MFPYDSVELTPLEVEAALLEARKKKWFHVKHEQHWIDEERKGIEAYEDELRRKREKAAQVRALKQRA